MSAKRPHCLGIIGRGLTGQSVQSYCQQQELAALTWDQAEHVQEERSRSLQHFMSLCDRFIVSPGVSPENPLYAPLKNEDCDTDIGLFCQKAPQIRLIFVTGSNGKTTTVELLGAVLQRMGQRVHTLGNNEKPVLNHIAQIQKGDWVILELSSAQLWWTKKLREAALAIITSFTPNHLDWHGSLEHYRHAKIKVLHSAQKAFCPDALYEARLGDHIQPWPALLSDKAQKALEQLPDDVFYSPSRYAAINVCHIAQALEWPLECVAQAFSQWQLLEYRSQIKKHHDIYWVNDSKSTTYASTLALFDTLSYSPEESVLILGGHLKGQNPASFLPLITKVAHILLIGQSALELHAVLREHATIVGDLPGAFKHLKNMRPKPRWVILSPGAASFDQFKDYKHRGQCFWSEVDNFYD